MKLVTFGDSFTHGQELDSPSTQAWPVLLAQKLNAQLLKNWGHPGVSNEYIEKCFVKQTLKQKPDIAVICWTICTRFDLADENGAYSCWPGADASGFGADEQPWREELVKYFTLHHCDRYFYRKYLRTILQCQAWADAYDIKLYQFNAFGNQAFNKKYLHKESGYQDALNTKNFLGWPYEGFVEWMWMHHQNQYIKPNGHPGEPDHELVATMLKEMINADLGN